MQEEWINTELQQRERKYKKVPNRNYNLTEKYTRGMDEVEEQVSELEDKTMILTQTSKRKKNF